VRPFLSMNVRPVVVFLAAACTQPVAPAETPRATPHDYGAASAATGCAHLGGTINGPELDCTPPVSSVRKYFHWSRGWGGIDERSATMLPRRR